MREGVGESLGWLGWLDDGCSQAKTIRVRSGKPKTGLPSLGQFSLSLNPLSDDAIVGRDKGTMLDHRETNDAPSILPALLYSGNPPAAPRPTTFNSRASCDSLFESEAVSKLLYL